MNQLVATGKIRRKTATLLLATLIVTGFCGVTVAGKKKRADQIRFSGFMEDYDQLRRVDGFSDFVYGYAKRPLILREYSKAMLDPVLVYFQPEARGVGIDPAKLHELTQFFRDRLIEELSEVRQIEWTDEPGPGVMRIRIALTDIEIAKGKVNTGAKVAGMAAGVGFLVPTADVGGATMECEILDSVTGERLVAVVDVEAGRRMMNFKSMKALGDVRGAIREWSREFRKNLERIHEGRLPKRLNPAAPESR